MQPTSQRNTLPTALTRFIGREREIGEVKQLLSERRLLTLTGAGGCGKTRLAIQVAHEVMDAFDDGVWWVELAALADETLVPQAMANALSVGQVSDQPVSETLAHFLHAKHLLLVIDNCEHLIRACAHLAEQLLRACPNLRLLATSREALAIAGETAWTVPSLSLPDMRQPRPTFADLAQYEAVQLFVERAVAVQPSFKLTELNASAIAQICQRLDGIPLAIELAAARVKVLQTAEIAARLDDRFQLLTAGSRTALPRHQTLRAAIDWSYNLLSDSERLLLRRLSVFAGGCTLGAAEQVCIDEGGRNGIVSSQILDLLSHLVDKSLVIVDNQSGETRYGILETNRQYARAQLVETAEEQRVRARHCDFFVRFAETAEPQLKGPGAKEWMDRLERDYDNIRAVFEYALSNDIEAAVRLASTLVLFWGLRTFLIEGRQLLAQLLARTELHSKPSWYMRTLDMAGYLDIYTQDWNLGRSLFEQGLTLAQSIGDRDETARALHGLGWTHYLQGDARAARPPLEASLTIFRVTSAQWGTAQTLFSLGVVECKLGNSERGQALLEESQQIFDAIGDIFDIVWPLDHLADLAKTRGDYERAADLATRCVEIDRKLDNRIHLGLVVRDLGMIVLWQGNYARAAEYLTESVELLRRRGTGHVFGETLIGMAEVILGFGKPAAAARILGAVDTFLTALQTKGISRASDREIYETSTNAVRAALGAHAYDLVWQEGRAMNLDQAIEFALAEMKPSEAPGIPLPSASARRAIKERFGGLTAREREVASLIARGESNREIAAELVVSERTVESHVTNILNKLGFTSRTQIRKWTAQTGLVKRFA